MDVVREFCRGAVRLHVLHHAAQGEVNGAWMSEELARHGYSISPGTLYPLLHALEADGLLTSGQRTEHGRVLRYYSATDAGRASLAQARRALAELAAELLPLRPTGMEAGP
jgi:DNA-binding PadR family transcriptional regulator